MKNTSVLSPHEIVIESNCRTLGGIPVRGSKSAVVSQSDSQGSRSRVPEKGRNEGQSGGSILIFCHPRIIARQEEIISVPSLLTSSNMNRALGTAKYAGGLALAGGIAIDFFIYDVDAGKRAVIFDKLQGVHQTTIGEGTHFRIPFIQVNFQPDGVVNESYPQ